MYIKRPQNIFDSTMMVMMMVMIIMLMMLLNDDEFFEINLAYSKMSLPTL